ncbi:MAG: hypothetical protein ACR2OZ_11020 [Verrucomicrobiales bacterium]
MTALGFIALLRRRRSAR